MATITLSLLSFEGGVEPLQLAWRTSSLRASLPLVLVAHDPTPADDVTFPVALAERLARAGFHVLSVAISGSTDVQHRTLAPLIDALHAAATTLPVHSSLGVVCCDPDGPRTIEVPPRRDGSRPAWTAALADDRGVDAVTRFLIAQLD